MGQELMGCSQGLFWPGWNLPPGLVPGAVRAAVPTGESVGAGSSWEQCSQC